MTQWPPGKSLSRLLRVELHDHVFLDRGRNGVPGRKTQESSVEGPGIGLPPVGHVPPAPALDPPLNEGQIPAFLPYGHHIPGPDLKRGYANLPAVDRKVAVQHELPRRFARRSKPHAVDEVIQ